MVVAIKTDTSPGSKVYDPNHPDADDEGLVEMPNVNVVEEMVNMMTAQRSFEANVQAFQTLRDMSQRAIDLGR
jgi:flagellar basal-body rod protein FlgC